MRIAAFDIETTDLRANMGILLCASIQEIVPPSCEMPPTESFILEIEDSFDPNPDKALAIGLRETLAQYNAVVTWNGKMFDRPFLNARLLYHNELPWDPQFHMDMMYYAGYSSARIGSKRLASVQQFLGITEQKTGLDWDVWKRARQGDPEAMEQVVAHCEIDVRVLAEAYWRLLPFVKNVHK